MKGKCLECLLALTASNCSTAILKSGKGKCRKCLSNYHKQWKDKNPERAKQLNRASCLKLRTKRNAEKRESARTIRGRYNRLRQVLRNDGVAVTDLLWKFGFYSTLVSDNSCHYCESQLSPTGHGLDRMNNALPHTADNVVPCCSFCNDRKGSIFSYEEMLLLVPALREIRRRRELNKCGNVIVRDVTES